MEQLRGIVEALREEMAKFSNFGIWEERGKNEK